MNFSVSNPNQIKRLLESKISHEDIKELVIEIKNPDVFLESLLLDLNESSDWPLAVNPALIVDMNNHAECSIRAKNIIECMIERDLYGLNVLDFGCGDGLVALEILARGAKKVVGYDLKPNNFWTSASNLILTTRAQEVASNGPYELILLYDVIDHIMNVEPSVVLEDLRRLLTPDGVIIARCHPWVSRHGAHLYTQLNRAFAHIIFDERCLRKYQYEVMPTRKIVHPIWAYKRWIEKAELKIIKEDKIQEPVEDYFIKNELLKSLIQRHFHDSPFEDYKEGKGDLSRVLSFHFVDYVLSREDARKAQLS